MLGQSKLLLGDYSASKELLRLLRTGFRDESYWSAVNDQVHGWVPSYIISVIQGFFKSVSALPLLPANEFPTSGFVITKSSLVQSSCLTLRTQE